MLRTEQTKLEGVLLIHLDSFEDHRGEYVETYNEKAYKEAGIDVKFVQDDYSMSTKHVLRGIHGDLETWKLISCPLGKIYLVVVNCDETAPQFRKWESFVLSERNKRQVLVPAKFGVAHLVLGERAIFQYKQSTYYNRAKQFTLLWSDPELDIWWPVRNPILSRRDQGYEDV